NRETEDSKGIIQGRKGIGRIIGVGKRLGSEQSEPDNRSTGTIMRTKVWRWKRVMARSQRIRIKAFGSEFQVGGSDRSFGSLQFPPARFRSPNRTANWSGTQH